MLGKVAVHQEKERWRSRMATVVAGCHILRAKVLGCEQDAGGEASFEILVDNMSGGWKLRKCKQDFRALVTHLDLVFPVEGGARGHERILPVPPPELSSSTFWQNARKLTERLQPKLDDYMRELLFLPPYISRSRLVLDFFLPSHTESLAPPKAFDPHHSEEAISEGGGGDREHMSSVSTSHSYSHSYSSSKIIPDLLLPGFVRIKVSHGSEVAVVDYDPEASFETFVRCAQRKLQAVFDPPAFTYKDPAGDLILIEDEEDLQAGIALLGRKLVLAA